MIYKKHLTTITLLWAGSFVVFLLVYILVLRPQRKMKSSIEQQLVQTRQIYDSAIIANSEETKSKLNEQLASLKGGLNRFVVDSGDSTNLTFDISRIAGSSKVSSFTIKQKQDVASSEMPDSRYLTENYLDISFTGTFGQFASFLNALERHQPIVFVDKFVISSAESRQAGCSVNMSLAVFVRKHDSG